MNTHVRNVTALAVHDVDDAVELQDDIKSTDGVGVTLFDDLVGYDLQLVDREDAEDDNTTHSNVPTLKCERTSASPLPSHDQDAALAAWRISATTPSRTLHQEPVLPIPHATGPFRTTQTCPVHHNESKKGDMIPDDDLIKAVADYLHHEYNASSHASDAFRWMDVQRYLPELYRHCQCRSRNAMRNRWAKLRSVYNGRHSVKRQYHLQQLVHSLELPLNPFLYASPGGTLTVCRKNAKKRGVTQDLYDHDDDDDTDVEGISEKRVCTRDHMLGVFNETLHQYEKPPQRIDDVKDPATVAHNVESEPRSARTMSTHGPMRNVLVASNVASSQHTVVPNTTGYLKRINALSYDMSVIKSHMDAICILQRAELSNHRIMAMLRDAYERYSHLHETLNVKIIALWRSYNIKLGRRVSNIIPKSMQSLLPSRQSDAWR